MQVGLPWSHYFEISAPCFLNIQSPQVWFLRTTIVKSWKRCSQTDKVIWPNVEQVGQLEQQKVEAEQAIRNAHGFSKTASIR